VPLNRELGIRGSHSSPRLTLPKRQNWGIDKQRKKLYNDDRREIDTM
jgi:hypothetical protein